MLEHFVIVAHVPTDSVMQGFIPELRNRDIPLMVITDQPERHQALSGSGLLAEHEIITADVFNPIAILNALTQQKINPAAIFTNSDHLQTAVAMVADYYQKPRKDWRACYRAKNKLAMRETIQAAGLDTLWFQVVYPTTDFVALDIPFPCIAKPVEGVASENVVLVHSLEELIQASQIFWRDNLGQPLLLEEYLTGPLHTLETIGDGKRMQVMGSFETFLSPPPYFIELGQHFSRKIAPEIEQTLLAQLEALGVNFSSCHTEFVLTEQGPKLIEVNYRNIGDQSDFLLAQALQYNIFSAVIDLYLGLDMPAVPEGSHSAQIHCQIAEQSGVIAQVPERQILEKDGCSVSFDPVCQVGKHHQQDNSNRDYLSILRGTGPSESVLSAVMAHFVEELKITFVSDTDTNLEVAS